MSPAMVMNEEEAMELLAFLVTAARIQVDEPPDYAPMRLLTAAERLKGFVLERVSPEGRAFLEGFLNPAPHPLRRAGFEQYVSSLDDLCREMAKHLVEQSGIEGRAA